MKRILEQQIEIDHLSCSDHFRDSVRKHPLFQFPLQLKAEPSFVSTEKGDLFLISEYISHGIDSILLNIFYVHKYTDNTWTEVLAIPHAKKVRVHGESICAIIQLEESRYSVSQYDLNGRQIQTCIIENEPDTQINLDSIYFYEGRVVYCYQYFLKQLSDIDRERYISSSKLEWREDTDKKLLSVYAFRYNTEDNSPLWNQSLNVCGLKVKWKSTIDESQVYDKDLGIKSFHQIVTLLHGNVMQIFYTDENISKIMAEDEYWYHVCFVYPDGTINDYGKSIGRVKRNPFHMEKEFSYANYPSTFFSGITVDKILVTYRIVKNEIPELVCAISTPTVEELDGYISPEKQIAFSNFKCKALEVEEQIKKQGVKLQKIMENTDPLSAEERLAERRAFQEFLEDTKDDIPEEYIDNVLGIYQHIGISYMKWRQREQGISAYGVAYNKLFFTLNSLEYPNTISLLAYFDVEKKETVLLEADKPWNSYVLGNVTNQYFVYFSGHDAEELGYRNGKLIIKCFSGEIVCTVSLDPRKDCIGFVEHKGVLHILYKDRPDSLNLMNSFYKLYLFSYLIETQGTQGTGHRHKRTAACYKTLPSLPRRTHGDGSSS